MIDSTQITSTVIFASIAILVFKLLNCDVLFTTRKNNRDRSKVGYSLRK